MRVPDVLISGDHAKVEEWRRRAAEEKTRRNRPDLLPPE
jgi:tRNA (guanine37-N1)-methyltransferase